MGEITQKKVLHLVNSNHFAGAENVVIQIIENLYPEYDSVYVSPQGSIEIVLEKKRIKHIAIDKFDIFEFTSICKKWKPDIIHAHDFRSSILSAMSLYKCKKISHIHQNPDWMKKINVRSLMFAGSCFFYDKVIVVSDAVLKESKLNKFFLNKFEVIDNFVDVEKIQKQITNTKNIYDVCFMGRLTDVKNPLAFIHLVKRLNETSPKKITAVMVGEGELRKECEELIITHSLTENIKMKGFLENPFEVLAESKILISTSKWEGFGLAAVEALTLGKPVFCPPVGGLQKIITEECGGHYNNEDEAVKKILITLSDEIYYNSLSRNAKVVSKAYTDKKNG